MATGDEKELAGSLVAAIKSELAEAPKEANKIVEALIDVAKLLEQDALDDIERDVINLVIEEIEKLVPPEKKAKLKLGEVQRIYKWDEYEKVESVEALQQIILRANSEKKKVRIVGAGHSPTRTREGIDSDQAAFKCILTGSFREMEIVELPVGDKGSPKACVVAGGGMHLSHDPSDPTSKVENGLLSQLYAAGYALNDLGGITHQTVAGFLTTGGRQVRDTT